MNHKSSIAAFTVTFVIVIGINQLLSAEQPDHNRTCRNPAATGQAVNATLTEPTTSTADEVGS